jgi:hypothetical protein
MTYGAIALAQEGEGKKDNPPQEQRKIPTDIAEAHAELERILSAEVLSEIDAMPSEGDMVRYQTGSGLSIGNGWGLWRGGLLAQRLQEWGFTDPHDASSLILETFWCKRHGQALRLEERFRGKAMEIQERRKRRVEQAKAMIPGLMMGLRFEKREVPVVEIPARSGMGVCFMCPFRDGVFLAVHCRGRIEAARFDRHMLPIRLYDGAFLTVDRWGHVEVSPFGKPIPPILPDEMDRRYADPPDGEIRRWVYYDESVVRGFYFLPGDREPRRAKPGDEFYTQGFYLDPTDRTIRRIRVAEVDEVYAAVVAGGRAWFAGLTNGKAVLVGVGDRDRITVPLPWEDEIPDLGVDDQSPLAVYSKAIYRLTDGTWTSLYFGDTLLPRSVPPPQRHGNMVLLRARDWGASRGLPSN